MLQLGHIVLGFGIVEEHRVGAVLFDEDLDLLGGIGVLHDEFDHRLDRMLNRYLNGVLRPCFIFGKLGGVRR